MHHSADPAAGSKDPAACAMDPAACSIDPAACSMDPAACSMDPAACSMDPAAGSKDPAACAMNPAACSMNPAACSMDPAAVSTQGSAPAVAPDTGCEEAAPGCEPGGAPTMKPALESQRGGGSGAQASLGSGPSIPLGAPRSRSAGVRTAAVALGIDNERSPAWNHPPRQCGAASRSRIRQHGEQEWRVPAARARGWLACGAGCLRESPRADGALALVKSAAHGVSSVPGRRGGREELRALRDDGFRWRSSRPISIEHVGRGGGKRIGSRGLADERTGHGGGIGCDVSQSFPNELSSAAGPMTS